MSSGNRQARPVRIGGFSSNAMVAGLLFLAALVGAAWVYAGMIAQERWPMRWLEIDGVFERVSAEQVRIRIAPLAEDSYFAVDLEAIRDAARSISWVARVQVRKIWPDTLRVTVHEFVPVAHWIQGKLIAADGSVFSVPGADEIQGLPWLEGPPEAVREVTRAWHEFDNELMPTGLEIARIRLDRRGAWYLRLTNGTEVFLGRDEASRRLRRMVASWPQLLVIRERMPATVDVRYSNGFAVRWSEPPARLADSSN